MKEFALIFRQPIPDSSARTKDTNEQQWIDWIAPLARSGVFQHGIRPERNGVLLKSENSMDHHVYECDGKVFSGLITVKISGLQQAIDIAAACPILKAGGSVEIREIMG